jgi:hypothetical protein
MNQDIANHQLQTLRPFLIDSSGQYELKAFKSRKGSSSSLDLTREWIESSHRQLLASPTLTHPSFPSGSLDYGSLSHTQKAYVSVLKGFTDLVFNPPSPALPSASSGSSAVVQSMCPLPFHPETTYLDSARLLALATDAADTAAMYMFLLLYRQLVFSDVGDLPNTPRDQSRVSDADLLKLKKEIRDISSSHLGLCFKYGAQSPGSDAEQEKWSKIKQDVVLQVALRAKGAQVGSSSRSTSSTDSHPPHIHAPDERVLKLAERWSDTHVRPNSALSTMLKNRIRDAVFGQVVALNYPPRDSGHIKTTEADAAFPPSSPAPLASGLEPLADEIRSLAERLSRLAHIHLGVYLPLYEQEVNLSDVTITS